MSENRFTNKIILITGAAGFIGANLVKELMKTNEPMTLIGLDNMNNYYNVSLKEYRLDEINKLTSENTQVNWKFIKGDLADKALIDSLSSPSTSPISWSIWRRRRVFATALPIPTCTYRAT